MTSTIKVDNIKDQASTNIVNKCGTTINIGAPGDTTKLAANTLRSNALQNACGGNTISKCGTTVTIGQSGDTVNLASGASQSGFGRSGSVNWQTGSIKTGTFSGTNGEGYFVDTSSGTATLNLPAGAAGSIVAVADYTRTFNSNNCTITPNGSEKIGGAAASATLGVNGQSATFVYVDGTEGWINVQETQTSVSGSIPYVTATVSGTGNTLCTVGDYKIAKFTGPGTFCVTSGGTAAPCSGTGSNLVDYMVVAGGGGAGGNAFHIQGGGGGGAGGFRASPGSASGCYAASPLGTAPATSLSVTIQGYPIQVGGGGTGGLAACTPNLPSPGAVGTDGDDSIFSTITSTGGGRGSQPNNNGPAPAGGSGAGNPGGSGGGGGGANPGPSSVGCGNTPATPVSQGNNGGTADTINYTLGGGGGGATAVGTNATAPACGGGTGGNGATSCITASPVTYATGGNSARPVPTGTAGNAGDNTGDGGTANNYYPGPCGASPYPRYNSFNGGSGIVIIRYKFQN